MMRIRGFREAKQTPGLRLENVPKSWLRQFIHSLPRQDRLSFFQTCTWLAREVVLSSDSLSLKLHPAPEWHLSNRLLRAWERQPLWKVYILTIVLACLAQQLVPGALSLSNFLAAFTVISWLGLWAYVRFMLWWTRPGLLRPLPGRIEGVISNHRKIRLTSCGNHEHPASLPLPCSLYSNVTALEVHDCRYGAFHRDFPLHAFSSLTKLTMLSLMDDLDMRHFSAALEAGHLQHLRSLKLDPTGSGPAGCMIEPFMLSKAVRTSFSQVAARMIGPNLTHLATNIPQMWDQLQLFTALQSVELGPDQPGYLQYCVQITPHVARQLCEHPTLRSVTLKACRLHEDWAHPSHMACGWQTLVLHSTYPHVLAAISLADLREIKFVGGLPECDISDVQQLQRVLKRPGPALQCTSDSFFVQGALSASAITLITHFTRVRNFSLCRTQELSPLLLDSWSQLPENICSLTMSGVTEALLRVLWDNMPISVSSIHIRYCDIPLETLTALLQAVPATVHTVGLTPLTKRESKEWARAKLHAVVPEHVKFTLQPSPLKYL